MLAHGDFVARGDRVESRLVFRFKDGSVHEETVVFSQLAAFTLLSYRIVQRGPSFPEAVEGWVDGASGRYEVRYRADEDSPEEHLNGTFALPDDAYNGMLSIVIAITSARNWACWRRCSWWSCRVPPPPSYGPKARSISWGRPGGSTLTEG